MTTASVRCAISDHIGDVIAVPVGNKDEIGGDLRDVDPGGEGIGPDKGVEEKSFAAGDDRETGVSVVGEFHDG